MDRFVPTRANYTLTARSSFIGIITALMATLLIAACGVSEQDVLASVEPLAITVNSATTDSADLEGQTVSGTAVVSVEAEGWMRSVRFYLDGVLARTVEEAPFELEIDTTTLADGPHTLGIEAVMPNGRVRLSEVVEFFVANEAGETAPPNSDEPTDPEPDPEPDPDPEPEPDPEPDPEPEPDPKPEPDPEPATTLLMAASSVDPITAFDTVQDTTAATGRYVAQPASVPASSSGDEVASVEFDIDVAGEYALWARLYGPDRDSDAVYIGFDGATNRVFTSEHGTWMWMKVDQAYLEAGSRRVSIGYGEPGLRLDVLAIVGDASIGAADLEHLAATESWPPHDGGDDGSTVTDPEPEPEPEPALRDLSMRGDTSFATSQLTSAERLWYDRTWHAVNATTSSLVSQIGNDNIYDYGRTIFQHNHSLLLALRSTGDLRFLDAVDTVTQAMRTQLDDSWCGGVESTVYVNAAYGTVSSPDGYLNFRLRLGNNIHTCRDTGDLNEALTHGHLALVMYAYHLNRNNPSPKGIDYGERADFWLDYLRNHFEAKWRERSNTTWPNMDFIDLKFTHTYTLMNLYYYFIGERLASDNHPDAKAYLDYADTLSEAYFTEPYVPGERAGGFTNTNTPYGDAVVYAFGAPRRGPVGTTHLEASPTTYARYSVSAFTVLSLEGHTPWDDAIMMKLANGMNAFVFDTTTITSSSDTLAADVTGGDTIGDIPPTTYRGRLTIGHFGYTTIPGLAIWDASGRIENLSLQAYDALESNPDRPTMVQIPVSMLLVEAATAHKMGMTASR